MGSKKYKFLINSLNHCFICFEEIQNNSSNISLLNILHYLKINLQEIQSLSKKPSSLLNQTDIQVSLCKDCENVWQRFTKFYNELQVIQLKLNSTLEDVNNLLENKETSRNEYLWKLQQPGNDQALKHSNILEDILSSIKEKCHRILEKTKPRLELKRLKLSDKVKPDPVISGDPSGSFIEVGKRERIVDEDEDYSSYQPQSPPSEEFATETVEYFDNLHPSSTEDPLTPDENKLSTTETKFPKNCKDKDSCPICKKEFSRKSSLKRHLRTHSSEKHYKCQQCTKVYRTWEGLAFHRSANHPTPADLQSGRKYGRNMGHFACKFCSKVYTVRSSYIGHLNLHTGNGYKCHVCNRNFSQPWKLKQHMAVHSEDRPFKCSKCGMKFKSKQKLMKHFKSNHMSELNAV